MKKAISLILAAFLFLTLFAVDGRESGKVETLTPAPITGEKVEDENEDFIYRGSWDGNEFSNEWSEINFTCPDGWVIASNEDIADMMGVMADVLDEHMLNTAKLVSIYDFMVQDPETGDNIILMYENLFLEKALDHTEDDFADALAGQTDYLEQALGVEYKIGERKTVELGGKEYLFMPMDLNGGAMAQNYYLRRVGNFMTAIIVTDTQDRSSEVFEEMFS